MLIEDNVNMIHNFFLVHIDQQDRNKHRMLYVKSLLLNVDHLLNDFDYQLKISHNFVLLDKVTEQSLSIFGSHDLMLVLLH